MVKLWNGEKESPLLFEHGIDFQVMKWKSKKQGSLILICLLGTLGCAGTFHVVVSDISSSGKNLMAVQPSQVSVFSSELTSPRKYIVVAKLSLGGDQSNITRDKIIQAFQERAGDLGANGIVLIEEPKNSEDIGLERAPENANDLVNPPNALQDYWAPVTFSRAEIYFKIGGNGPFRGYALAIKF